MESSAGEAVSCVGLTYESASFDLLERMAVSPPEAARIAERLRGARGVRDAMVLATCNRLEVYLAGDGVNALAAVAGVFPAGAGSFVERRGICAVEHLFAVTCGLDSLAVGEEQIVHQVREAGRGLGPTLTRLVGAALRTSRRARTETAIGGAGRSLVALALDEADTEGAALVVGAGTMGRLVAQRLQAAGDRPIYVANRGIVVAERVAAQVGGKAVALAGISEVLGECGLVVVAVRGATPVLPLTGLRNPVVIVDLGLPRMIGPEYRRLPGVTVINLEDLARRTDRRADDLSLAWEIVAEEAARYAADRERALAAPIIGALRTHARSVVEAELVRLHRRLPGLDDRMRKETATAIERVVGKLLHEPTLRARELAAATDGPLYLDALSRLFGAASDEVNR